MSSDRKPCHARSLNRSLLIQGGNSGSTGCHARSPLTISGSSWGTRICIPGTPRQGWCISSINMVSSRSMPSLAKNASRSGSTRCVERTPPNILTPSWQPGSIRARGSDLSPAVDRSTPAPGVVRRGRARSMQAENRGNGTSLFYVGHRVRVGAAAPTLHGQERRRRPRRASRRRSRTGKTRNGTLIAWTQSQICSQAMNIQKP